MLAGVPILAFGVRSRSVVGAGVPVLAFGGVLVSSVVGVLGITLFVWPVGLRCVDPGGFLPPSFCFFFVAVVVAFPFGRGVGSFMVPSQCSERVVDLIRSALPK